MGLTLLMLVGLGIAWALVGVSQSWLASRSAPIVAFYALGTSLAAPVAWAMVFDWRAVNRLPPRLPELAGVLFLANLFNCAGQVCLLRGMRMGHRASTLAIAQSAMGLAFFATVVLWDEAPGLFGYGGLLAMLGGVALLAGRENADGDQPNFRWILAALGAMLLIATGMVLSMLPSHWAGWQDAANLRAPLWISLSAGIYVSTAAISQDWPTRRHLAPGLLWAGSAVAAFWLLFRTIDRLSALNCAGVLYPIGTGLSILFFTLYSRFRLQEPYSQRIRLGLGLVAAGIVALAARVLLK